LWGAVPCLKAFLPLLRSLLIFPLPPTACAVGFILSPLRGSAFQDPERHGSQKSGYGGDAFLFVTLLDPRHAVDLAERLRRLASHVAVEDGWIGLA
jgi:hypothetical protein